MPLTNSESKNQHEKQCASRVRNQKRSVQQQVVPIIPKPPPFIPPPKKVLENEPKITVVHGKKAFVKDLSTVSKKRKRITAGSEFDQPTKRMKTQSLIPVRR